MKRRSFITLLGGAAAWPLVARAQQMANLPAVGFLGAGSPATADVWLSAFMSRLRELGWIEGRNITVQQHGSLLVSRLDRHKAHRRAPNSLADRFRIGGIVLVALDVRLHVLRGISRTSWPSARNSRPQ